MEEEKKTGCTVYPLSEKEEERIQALESLEVLDSLQPEASCFERITELACTVFEVPMALISLVDKNRQWFLAHTGLPCKETPREYAFCNYVVANPCENPFMIVNNALEDARFMNDPLVTGFPDIRFYVGVPLHTEEDRDIAVGTLCLLDRSPRDETETSQSDIAKLKSMADIVADLLQRHRSKVALERKMQRQELVGACSAILNPMHSLRHCINLFEAGELPKLEAIEAMKEAVDQLTSTAELLSSAKRWDLEEHQFTKIKTKLHGVLHSVVQFFRPFVPGGNISFFVELPKNFTLILESPKLVKCLECLFMLSLRGVITASDKPGECCFGGLTIHLHLSKESDEVCFELKTIGASCPPVRLEDGKFSYKSDGLNLAARLAEQLDGSIEIWPSAGSASPSAKVEEVVIRLKLATKTQTRQPTVFIPSILPDRQDDVQKLVTRWPNAAKEPPSTAIVREDEVVLVFEDEQINRLILFKLLCKRGFAKHNVVCFEDGDQFVLDDSQAEPSLVLLDIHMPKMNGDRVCQIMRDAGWSCPIIAVTGNSSQETRRLLDIGFDKVFFKPFEGKHVDSILKKFNL